MRELIKAMLSFSWGLSLFGVKQLGNLLTPPHPHQPQINAATAFDVVTHATEGQLDGAIKAAFQAGDRVQRGLVDMIFGALPTGKPVPSGPTTSSSGGEQKPPASAYTAPSPAEMVSVDSGRLDTTSFIALGEGLAAGMGNFTLSADAQRDSFPAQMARQMRAHFAQPLMQAPGIGNPVGFEHLPVLVPAFLQTTVLDELPPPSIANLSVPGFTLNDALNLRPVQPLVHRHDAKQTAANLILGLRPMARGEPLLTQIELALQRQPTFAVIELGYH